MTILQLAFRNLIGAGLRTWLNVIVLSLSFVLIIWTQGLFNGMEEHASKAMIDSELGSGQYWHSAYDPFDPFSLQDAHAHIPSILQKQVGQNQAAAILITQATIYPQGRIQSVLLKGIDPGQSILNIPTRFLNTDSEDLPALIGTRMAKNASLKIGDYITVRWRDTNGVFDARNAFIVQIMSTSVQSIDNGQIWVPLQALQKMTEMDNEATLIVMSKTAASLPEIQGWKFKDLDFLLRDITELVKNKKGGSYVLYIILLFLAMLAIFNTQVLSVFRRQKEIGTLIALGMTRAKVIQLFTLEGAFHGILAAIVGAVYGIPLLAWFSSKGLTIPKAAESFGIALGRKLYPIYSLWLVFGTTALVLLIVTIISYLPVRRISRMKPTDALRGKSL